MHKPETSRRMLKWTIELGQFDIECKPMNAIKGQALANFVLEFPPQHAESRENMLVQVEAGESPPTQQDINKVGRPEKWTLNVNGAVNNDGADTGIVLTRPEGYQLMHAIHFSFGASNNNAEYEALIAGPRLALAIKVENLIVQSDLILVVY